MKDNDLPDEQNYTYQEVGKYMIWPKMVTVVSNFARKNLSARQIRFLFAYHILARIPILRDVYCVYAKRRRLKYDDPGCVLDSTIKSEIKLSQEEKEELSNRLSKPNNRQINESLWLGYRLSAFVLNGCQLLPQSLTVMDIIRKEYILCPHGTINRNVVRPHRYPNVVKIGGLSISMLAARRNYFHFLLDHYVVLLHMLEEVETLRNGTLLVRDDLSQYQKVAYEILLAKYPSLKMHQVKDNEKVICEKLMYPCRDFGDMRNLFAPTQILRQIGNDFRDHYEVSKGATSRLLFISRSNQKLRRLNNEEELFCRLREMGFERIRPESLSHPDQVETFSQARLVIGTCGAALTNLVFCNPGTAVIEICPAGFAPPFWMALTKQIGGKHFFVSGGEPGWHESYNVNIDKVVATLSIALAECS